MRMLTLGDERKLARSFSQMTKYSMRKFLMSVVLFTLFVAKARSVTNDEDVYALNVLFTAVSSPPTLPRWRAIGGDPCGEDWAGVGCVGPNVTKLHLSGLNLTGGLGYALENLTALVVLDLSSNNLTSDIPYQLPPNLEELVLSDNHFIGNLPYSVTYLYNLSSLNVSNNMLSRDIPDIFAQLEKLTLLDFSKNNLSGPLPLSFGTLTHVNTMCLQDNHLSGTIDILASLPLKNLDISNNSFTGWIPSALATIPSFKYAGNRLNFSTGIPTPGHDPPPPSPPSLSAPPHVSPSDRGETQIEGGTAKYLTEGHIAGIAVAAVLTIITAVLVVLLFLWKNSEHALEGKDSDRNPSLGSGLSPAKDPKEQSDSYSQQKHKPVPDVVTSKPYGVLNRLNLKETSVDGEVLTKNIKSSIAAASYTIGELQIATNSFSQENLIGEGTSARVYKAKLPNGKILAVKKLDSSISMVHEGDFLDVLVGISRLRHANITELVGYCVEQGHRLLVYEHISNGTLNETLHFGEEKSRRLSWNLRMKIALGAARALEYLHEICQPMVVHRNFKSSNILLDDEFNPHLSDCGLVSLKSFGSERQFSSQHMGSFGYSAPEFAMSGMYSVKSDVYSFGVVMLETLTGRKPLDSSRPRAEQSLVRWATPQLHDIDALSKMVDPALKGIYPAKSLSRFADLIAVCVQPEPEFRPCMSEVTQSLVRLLQRASLNKRRSREDLGSSQRIFDSLSEV